MISVVAGLNHCLAIRSDGSLIGWGGQEHQGGFAAWVPTDLGNVVAAAGGWYHSLAVREDGKVIVWGFDMAPEGTIVNGLSNITAVSAGYSQNFAINSNGAVFGWDVSSLPRPMAGLSDITAISSSTHHSLGVKRDGTVTLVWNNSPSVSTNLPDDLTDISAIAAGGEYEGNRDIALKNDGTVVGWGSNSGQTNVPANLKLMRRRYRHQCKSQPCAKK